MGELKEVVSLRGIFKMNIYKWKNDKKELIETFEDNNLIVDLARTTMAHLIAGDVINKSMKSISFGTNGNEPNKDDTKITNPFIKDLDNITYPTDGQVSFAWNLSTSEANGSAILEFGLLTADGNLFCRRTRITPINKENDISLEGLWTILF
jgi:hypothetical protein